MFVYKSRIDHSYGCSRLLFIEFSILVLPSFRYLRWGVNLFCITIVFKNVFRSTTGLWNTSIYLSLKECLWSFTFNCCFYTSKSFQIFFMNHNLHNIFRSKYFMRFFKILYSLWLFLKIMLSKFTIISILIDPLIVWTLVPLYFTVDSYDTLLH